MDETKKLKCACANCGETIDYEPKAIGQIIACPKCGEKSRLPAVQPDPVRAEPGEPEPPPRVCPVCGDKLYPKQVTCTRCENRRRKKRAAIMWIAVSLCGLAALAALVMLSRHRESERRLAETGPYQLKSAVDGPIPQPRVRTPKSINDLKIGTFVFQKPDANGVCRITGDVANVSENLHRGITLELEILDAQGEKIGVLTERIVVLDGRGIWHILTKTSDPQAAAVRVGALREE